MKIIKKSSIFLLCYLKIYKGQAFLKKGAMFGLDARIALAIFGALSVISGAALYSAIQNSRATALYVNLSELAKAWEHYYLDTGTHLAQHSTDSSSNTFYILNSSDLIVNNENVDGWDGPYIGREVDSSDSRKISSDEYGTYNFLISKDSTSWGGSSSWNTDLCTSGESCMLFVGIDTIPDNDIAIKIDELYDNGNGSNEGIFKWITHSVDSTTYYAYFLKVAPIENPNSW